MASSPGGDRAWEDLRKEARKIEGEVDVKLAAFSKLGSQGVAGESSQLMAAENGEQQIVATKSAEIEKFLQRLGDINDAMSSAVSGGGDARSHTLARHRDILHEFTQEFRRIRSTITAGRERDALLGGNFTDSLNGDFFGGQSGNGSNGAAMLRERNAINSSNMKLDDVIGQAQATMSALTSQRSLFEDMGGKLNQVSSKFPVVNGIMNAIRRKRSKDSMILSAVIAGCTLFLIIYWLSK
eukprot:CAMPEP_0197849806 /NCGR_PEP_ID=MMETSP1438-20131217/13277_1 /TAXON_ID=1461541 /ORGANISM="Pterosperma sp., Strain CCMP1384" /LENGTH=239 /DNA_ID=CAMNT_0043462651 /DNA_START=253 /DNA_END=972 /DNA_ORIENTATION=+